MGELVSLGYISRAFGIKGGVSIKLFNPESQALSDALPVIAKYKQGQHNLVVDTFFSDGRIFFREITDRTQAEALVGAELFVERDCLPKTSHDEFYLFDLKGAHVTDVSGDFVGSIVGFSSNNAQDLFLIETPDKKTITIPYVKPIVTKIDCENKLVVIDPPTGLLQL